MPTTRTTPIPGPYDVGSNGTSHPRHAICADGTVIAKVYGRGVALTRTHDRARYELYGPTPATEATAALLAAAPELRDALARIVDLTYPDSDFACGRVELKLHDAVRLAGALLARIDGGAR